MHFHHLLMAAAKSCLFSFLFYFYTTHKITHYCHGPVTKPQSTKDRRKSPLAVRPRLAASGFR